MKNRTGVLTALFSFWSAAAVWAGEAAGHAGEHAEQAEEGASMHLPNVINILHHCFPHNSVTQFLHEWENVIFSLAVAAFLALVFTAAAKKNQLVPGGLQNVCEMAFESLDNFVTGILGDRWRKFTPFIGTIFLYIFTINFP